MQRGQVTLAKTVQLVYGPPGQQPQYPHPQLSVSVAS